MKTRVCFSLADLLSVLNCVNRKIKMQVDWLLLISLFPDSLDDFTALLTADIVIANIGGTMFLFNSKRH